MPGTSAAACETPIASALRQPICAIRASPSPL